MPHSSQCVPLFRGKKPAGEYPAARLISIRKIGKGLKAEHRIHSPSLILDFVLDTKMEIDNLAFAARSWHIAFWPPGKRKIINQGNSGGYLLSFLLAESWFPEYWFEWNKDNGAVTTPMVYLLLKILNSWDNSSDRALTGLDLYSWRLLNLLKESAEEAYPIQFAELEAIYAVGELLDVFDAGVPTVADLVRLSGVKTHRFQLGFRLLFGLPAQKMLQQLRMKEAYARLLIRGENSCKTGQALGYVHTANFVTAFRAYFGIAPGAAARYLFK